MGFSVAAAFLIIMLALFLSIGLLGKVILDNAKNVYLLNENKIKIYNTNFKISSVNTTPLLTTPPTYDMDVVICNTGSTTLSSAKFTFLVDGKVVTPSYYNNSYLYPLKCVRFNFTNLPGAPNSFHVLKVVSENGVARYATYTV